MDPNRDIRFVPPSKIAEAVVSPPLPAGLQPTDLVKAHYGCPDHLFVGRIDESKITPTDELKNPRFIDVRLIGPSSLSAGHDVIAMWYRHLLDNGLSLLPAGALTNFAADRELLSGGATGLSAPKLTASPQIEALVDSAMHGALVISKTVHGVSDTSCSAEKPKPLEGPALSSQSIQNLKSVLTRLLSAQELHFKTPEDVIFFVETISRELNAGIPGATPQIWRTWPLADYPQVSPQDIPSKLYEFGQNFVVLYNCRGFPAVKAAAIIENEFNGVLHPLADGCGRTSILMAALFLAREGLHYPKFPSREEYYDKVRGDSTEWLDYYSKHVRPQS